MTKREVAFFNEKRRSLCDAVKFLRDLGYSDEQIKDLLLKSQAERNAQKAKQETEGKGAKDA